MRHKWFDQCVLDYQHRFNVINYAICWFQNTLMTPVWPCVITKILWVQHAWSSVSCVKIGCSHQYFPLFPHFSCCSVPQSCLTLCDHMDCSTPGFPVLHHIPELAQTHVHQVGDAIQPSHPLSSPSPPAVSLSQHQGLFQWVNCLHQVAKVLELQLQHQSFQWIFRVDFL